MNSNKEKKFIKRLEKYPDKFLLAGKNSVMEGFEYFKTEEYRTKENAIQHRGKAMLNAGYSKKELFRLGAHIAKIFPSIKKNMDKNFSDIDDYLNSVESNKNSIKSSQVINNRIWEELKDYAWKNHKVIISFTEVPKEFVFSGKGIPFKYALVLAQEMDKEAIEKAPKLDAGMEVVSIYNSLGIASNDIADYLRKNHNLNCMANHPLGGLVDTVPLAEKAGLGAIGRNGCLITKEFGSRCRITPIFIEEKIFEFTDSDKHLWINDFCKRCGACVKNCPTSAIYQEEKLTIDYKKDFKNRYSSYDREKCFTSFAATMGCAVCISVCPFSKNPGIYDKIVKKYSEK